MTAAPVPSCASCGATLLAGEGFCETCGAPIAPVVADHGDLDLGIVAAVSDRGLLHAHNEDAFALGCHGSRVTAVVCDGVSASVAPAFAARAAANAAEVVLGTAVAGGDEDDPAAALHRITCDAVAAAQQAVGEIPFVDGDGLAPPSCTLVSALWDGRALTVGSIGDSRAYWIGTVDARCLTVDDSWARSQVDRGLATPAEAARDSRAHAITHWIGADAPTDPPQVVTFEPTTAGHLMVCTDGLWNHLPEVGEIAEAVRHLAGEPPLAIARALVRTAIARGGTDNVTVAVIEVPSSSTTPDMEMP